MQNTDHMTVTMTEIRVIVWPGMMDGQTTLEFS
jgi:hypothetical protein